MRARITEPADHGKRLQHARALLARAAEHHAGRIVQVTSLGVEGMVLTDLIARDRLPIVVATLDTGALHEQTLALLANIRERYCIAVECHRPQPDAVVEFVNRHGPFAMRTSVALRQACCDLRKVEPMQRLLAGREAWITGLRRDQSAERAATAFESIDAQGRHKIAPLADWSEDDVWFHVQQHDVPYNRLHDEGFPSIGCQPCTRAIAPGEDPRAGRWWWEASAARECGLHNRPLVPLATGKSSGPGGTGPSGSSVASAPATGATTTTAAA